MLREALLQYQQQVMLYEKLSREVGGPRDDAELRAQLRAQEVVVKVRALGPGQVDLIHWRACLSDSIRLNLVCFT